MKILNDEFSDYHIHSSTFSDGLATVEEIVRFAGEMWLKEIAITDHSDFVMRKPMTPFRDQGYPEGLYEFYPSGARYDLKRWQNVHNDVKVIFGVEADVMNEQGEVCFTIQGQKPDFILLALHSERYRSEPETATLGLVNAIEKYHDEIVCICHPCDRYQFGEYIDIKKIVETANKYHIPIELNGKTMCWGQIIEKLDYVLEYADEVYVNSDAHTLWDIKELKKPVFAYLKERGYLPS